MYAKGIVYNDSTYFLPAGNSSPMCSVFTCYEKKKLLRIALKTSALLSNSSYSVLSSKLAPWLNAYNTATQ